MKKPAQSPGLLLALTAGAAILVVGCETSHEVIQQTPTGTTQPSMPRVGTPLIWYRPNSGPMMALDWTGKPAGQVAVEADGQSPDGSKLSTSTGDVHDITGQLIGHIDISKGGGPFWADDSSHWCSFVSAGTENGHEGPQTIWLKTLDGKARSVAAYGTGTGESWPQIVACSTSADRVVAAQRAIGWVTDVTAFKLSTGARIYQRSYHAQEMARVWASRDGLLLVEDRSVPGHAGEPGGGTVVRSLLDGTVLAQFGDLEIIAFSWDGSVALMVSKTRRIVQAILWRNSSVLWSAPFPNPAAGPENFLPAIGVLARPDSSDLAVSINQEKADNPATELWLISGGTGRLILRAQIRPAFQSIFF